MTTDHPHARKPRRPLPFDRHERAALEPLCAAKRLATVDYEKALAAEAEAGAAYRASLDGPDEHGAWCRLVDCEAETSQVRARLADIEHDMRIEEELRDHPPASLTA